MAGSINRMVILGNVGKDPETKNFSNGGKMVNLTVATSESWKDRQTGEQREKTEWHKVAIFNDHLVGVVEKYVRKGSKVYVEGKLQTRKYTDQGGQDRYITEIVVQGYDSKLIVLTKQESQEGARSGGGASSSNYSGAGGYSGGGEFGQDEDMPF